MKQTAYWYDALPRPQFAQFSPVAVDSSWFTVYQIQDSIFVICEPHHFQENFSFLLLGSSHAVLIDSGLGMGDIRSITQQLTALPVSVVNTHTHFDHIGGNSLFERCYIRSHPAAEARLSTGYTAKELGSNLAPQAFDGKVKPPVPLTQFQISPCRFQTLADGEVLKLGSLELQCIAAPGHSDDSTVFALHSHKLLFMGDVFYPGPLYAFAQNSMQKNILAVYQQTLEKLAGRFSSYTLLCAHNEPVQPGCMLQYAADAFKAIQQNMVPYTEQQNGLLHSYAFSGFSILTDIF